MKKTIALSVAAVTLSTAFALPASADTAAHKDIVILYTNDVHCGIDDNIGYDGLALYKREMQAEHENVILVDAGDSIQGDSVGTISDGSFIIELMNKVGYDAATIGNHEFDYGIPTLIKRGSELSCGFTCCNFIDLNTGEPVFEPYKIMECGGTKIAFVGVATPESFSKSTPTHFQNDAGEYVYSFCSEGTELIDIVQDNVSKARNEGADYVILLAHLGENYVTEEWTSLVVAANTADIDAIIDGHSHEVTPSLIVKNKEGKDVPITQTGTKLENIGKMTITDNGITTELIGSVPAPSEDIPEDTWTVIADRGGADRYVDAETNTKINEINDEISVLDRKVGETPFTLYDCDPETGERRVRNGETNLGNLCADAMRALYDTDTAIMNGGGIRKSIQAGDIRYLDLLNTYPYSNDICAARVTGQQILDYLESGVMNYPGETGGFPHVSGIEYTIDTSVKSSVTTNEYGEFTGVSGEYRVKNVLINGKPLEKDKVYSVASIKYLLAEGGDGYIFSRNCDLYMDEGQNDVEVLMRYIQEDLGGVIPERYRDPYGEGRIKVTDGTEEKQEEPEKELAPDSKPDISAPTYTTYNAWNGHVAVKVSTPAGTAGTSESASTSAPADPAANTPAPTAAEDSNPATGAAVSSVAVIALAAAMLAGKKR